MVKLGVFSDTHVGRSIPKDIASLRRKAFRHAFTQAIDIFIERKVDYVIHGGDVFERRSMTPEDSIFVKKELQRLIDNLNADLKIFLVRGNHDGTIENNAINYIEHPLAEYLKALGDGILKGEPEIYIDENVAVTGLGYTPYTSIRLKEAKTLITDILLKSRSQYRIFLLHAFVRNHQNIPPGVPEHQIVDSKDLAGLGADLIVCGHNHQYSPPSIVDGATLLTPGGTEAIDLADEGSHGVCIVELAGENIRVEYVPIHPLYMMRNISISSELPRPQEWYLVNVLRESEKYTAELESKGEEGILRIIIEGTIKGDKYELEELLRSELMRVKDENPCLLYVALENRLREEAQTEPMKSAGKDEILETALELLGEKSMAEAARLIEEVEMALDEEASSKTGLLTDSARRRFVERWLKILEAEG